MHFLMNCLIGWYLCSLMFPSRPSYTPAQKELLKRYRRGECGQFHQPARKERVLLWLPFGHSIVW